MTLKQGKDRVLALLDETSSSVDAETADKFNILFDMAQREAALVIPNIKTAVICAKDNLITVPDDALSVVSILDKDFKRIDLKKLGANQFIAKNNGEFIIEYCAQPLEITTQTPDSYEFEIPICAHDALSFFVAAHCVNRDVDLRYYQMFMSHYQSALANILINKMPVEINSPAVFG